MYRQFDPILQQDGTLLTRIDVAILSFCKLLAAMFLSEDDEDYTPAFKRMIAFGGFYFLVCSITFSVLIRLGALWPFLILAAVLLVLSRLDVVKCEATGTVRETQSDKMGALATLITIPIFATVLSLGLRPSGVSSQAYWIYLAMSNIGLTYVILLIGYVRRLGEPPKKREKAKVLQPVFHH